MKTILSFIILALVLITTSCDKPGPIESSTPSGPDPLTLLEEKMETERQLREEAEAKVEEEITNKSHWQLAAIGLSGLAMIAFFGGTAIGSRGRHHASATT